MTRPPDTPALAPPLPAGYALRGSGLVVPEGEASTPSAQRETSAVGAAWRKGLKMATTAAALALLAIAVQAASDARNTDVAARATARAAVCTATYDDRRDARARGQRVSPELHARIRQCERDAELAP